MVGGSAAREEAVKGDAAGNDLVNLFAPDDGFKPPRA